MQSLQSMRKRIESIVFRNSVYKDIHLTFKKPNTSTKKLPIFTDRER